jgi:hypothetical protein
LTHLVDKDSLNNLSPKLKKGNRSEEKPTSVTLMSIGGTGEHSQEGGFHASRGM